MIFTELFNCVGRNILSVQSECSPNLLLMTLVVFLGLAFAAGFSEAFSSSCIRMPLTSLSILFTIRIQDTIWLWNKDWPWTSMLYPPLWLQTCMSEILCSSRWRKSKEELSNFDYSQTMLRSIVWKTSGLLTMFQIVARIFAASFPVPPHWLELLQEEVECSI